MSDSEPTPRPKPVLKRIDGPPRPPTRTTLGLMGEDEPPRQESPTVEMVTTVTNATVVYGELLILKGGGRHEKRERIGLSLDRNVILLSKLVPKMQGEDLQIVQGTLRDIRNYRRRFPRTDASNQEQAAQAQKVLDAVPEV